MSPAGPAYLVLPGYGGSGPAHWQTLWEASDPAFRRVDLGDWESPSRVTWVERLTRATSGIRGSGGPAVLVAHSLACLLVAHWAASDPGAPAKVGAAFLVAPPDPEGPAFPAAAAGFTPVPRERLPFPSLLVASSDDPYADAAFARGLARDWGSRLAEAGRRGHINAASGLGDWSEGRALLAGLIGPGGQDPPEG